MVEKDQTRLEDFFSKRYQDDNGRESSSQIQKYLFVEEEEEQEKENTTVTKGSANSTVFIT